MEWVDKISGEAEINIAYTAEFAEEIAVALNRSVYIFTNCTAHGFSQSEAASNIYTLLQYNDYVDVILVGYGGASSVPIAYYTFFASDSPTTSQISSALSCTTASAIQNNAYLHDIGSTEDTDTGMGRIDTLGSTSTSGLSFGSGQHYSIFLIPYAAAEYIKALETLGLEPLEVIKGVYISSDNFVSLGTGMSSLTKTYTGLDVTNFDFSTATSDIEHMIEIFAEIQSGNRYINLTSSSGWSWNSGTSVRGALMYLLMILDPATAWSYWDDTSGYYTYAGTVASSSPSYSTYGYLYGQSFDTIGLYEVDRQTRNVTITTTIDSRFTVDASNITVTNGGTTDSYFLYDSTDTDYLSTSKDASGNTVVSITIYGASADNAWELDINIPITLNTTDLVFTDDSDNFDDVCISTTANAIDLAIFMANGLLLTYGDSDLVSVDSPQLYKNSKPSIALVKTASSSDAVYYAGEVVTWTLEITNDGEVTLTDLDIAEMLEGATVGTIVYPTTTGYLYVGETATAVVSYALTQADVDSGGVSNTASVTALGNDISVSDVSSASISIDWDNNISLVKTANVELVENAWAGTSTITYSFTVTNTGNTTLDNIVLTDPLIGSASITLYDAGGNVVSALAPDEQAFGTATYTLTQDDIDAGIVKNTATVVGDDPSDNSVNNTNDENVNVEQLPSIDIVKDVVGDATIEDAYAGDWVQFSVTITNTGNTTLYNATIADLLEGATFVVEELEGVTFTEDNTVIVEKMSPEDSVTVYVDYQLLQSDVDRGDTENIASVVADPPTGLEQVTDDDDAEIKTPSTPSISLVKVANVESVEFALPGDVIYYTLTITNTGNTTISNLALYDELLAGELEVFVGEENDEENSDDAPDAELNDEGDDNTTGDPDGSEDEADSSIEDETVIEESVPNAGNVSEALDTLVIAPGESAVAIIQYTLTQDDIDAGYVYNIATTTGEDPHGTIVNSEDDYTIELIASPLIMLTKTVAAANDVAEEDLTVGDELTYTFVIANSGNQTITDITLYDELLGGNIDLANATKGIDMTVVGYESEEDDTGEETMESVNADSALTISSRAYYTEHTEISADDPITTLRPGEYIIIEVSYTLTQDDLNNGRVDNTATTTGIAPDGGSVADASTAVMYLPQHPSIKLLKEADIGALDAASAGDMIRYTFTITNTGDVSLANLVLTDELDGIVIDTSTLEGLILTPGETIVISAEYVVTSDDLSAGSVYNYATVSADSIVPLDNENVWSGAQYVSSDDEVTVSITPLPQTGDNNILLISSAMLVAIIAVSSIVSFGIVKNRKMSA